MKTKLLFVLLFISSLTYAQHPTNGLIGEYPFTNGTFLDVINGDNFVQTGTALTTLDDRFTSTNDAINLGGDYLTRPNVDYPNSGYDIALGSVSFWMKTTTNNSDIKTIIDDTRDRSNQTDNTWSGYYVYLRDGKIGVSLKVRYSGSHGYEGTGSISPQVISDGNWHHIVVTFKNNLYFTGSSDIGTTSVALYVDGSLADNDGVTESGHISNGGLSFSQSIDQNGNVTIGNNKSNNLPTINKYDDTIDDILFYGRRLSASEIANIANYNYCFALSNSYLVSSTITENSINIKYNPIGTYEIAYAQSGQPFTNATVITSPGGTWHTINGLASDTDYDFYIRENCMGNIWSDWSSPKTVHTLRPFGIIYVDADATGNNDGYSWTDAFTNLQDAIAVSAVQNQEIWIAEGIYMPDVSDKTVSFDFLTYSKVYGGFVGTETYLSERDLAANHKTILSGDLNGDDTGVDFTGNNRSDNSYHVMRLNHFNIIVDGVTIQDGHAVGSGNNYNNYDRGGAVYFSNGTTTINFKNCEFKNNVGKTGGAMYIKSVVNNSLNIENCIFDNNISRYASGIYLLSDYNSNTSVNITNSLFTNNISKNLNGTDKGYTGSSMWIRANSSNSTVTTTITNCTFANNSDIGTQSSSQRGPLALGRKTDGTSTHNTTVNNCIFYGNTGAGGVVTKSINKGHTYLPNSKYVNNSIGEDNFSNLANLTNTSDADPLFTDSANNDFTLQATSPAIDTGDNNFVLSGILSDLAQNLRIHNTTVDMGVYEYGSPVLVTKTLVVNKIGNGTVSPEGSTLQAENSVVNVTATANSGWSFDGWSGDSSSVNANLNITMDANKTFTATFSQIQYELTLSGTNGSITPDSGTLNNGVYTYSSGASVILTATPDVGLLFSHYIVTDSNGSTTYSNDPLTITMNDHMSVEVFFVTEVRVYVDKDANGNNNGTNWTDAYTSLQTAIDNHTDFSKAIWVKQGIYTPNNSGTARKSSYVINKPVKIYGGFDGSELTLSDRDLITNPTILSGDVNNDDNAIITNETDASRQDNLYHIVTLKGNFASGGLMDGFTITDGNANGSLSNSCSTPQNQQYDDRSGAAIYGNPDGGSRAIFMKFKQCIIEKNTATIGAISYTFGPCGASGTRSTLDFESCIMRDNYTKLYENMYFAGSQTYDNKRYGSIVNSLLYNNKTDGANRGSVLLLSSGGSGNYPACEVNIDNSTFTNNISPNNYALKVSMTNQAGHIYNSIIYGNGSLLPIAFAGVAHAAVNNIIEGGQYNGNYNNPLFVNSANNNFTLQATSPAIDTGNNNLIPAGISTDLNGYDRIYNITVDMGCYEYDPANVTTVNDINNNLAFMLYPNPVNNVLNIVMDEELLQATVYNLQGQKIIENNTSQLNVSQLSIGFYLIKVETTEGNIATKRFIKK